MTDSGLLLSLCRKLGHGLEEVRKRALDSILLKLDRGFIKISELSSNKDFLVKLLEWFGLQPCPSQEEVLSLILRILKEKESEHLVAQIGAQRMILALNTIRENLPSELCPLLDDIVGVVQRAQIIQTEREVETCSYKQPSNKLPDDGLHTTSSQGACLLDASLEKALQENFTLHDSTESFKVQDQFEVISSNVLNNILLPWQPLISTDRHVLLAVESSLTDPVDRLQLLNSCSFITDVMMRDFPPEVFLQRPDIITTFMRRLKSCLCSDDYQLASLIITCLLTLTNALLQQLQCYRDPNMSNLKQEIFLHYDEDTASQISAESLLSNIENQGNVEGLSKTAGWNYIGKMSELQDSSISTQPSASPSNKSNEGSHYSETHIPTNSVTNEESSLLRLQQCSIPQFCLLAMCHVLPHVDTQSESTTLLFKLSRLLTNCVTPQIWLAPATDLMATDIATHLYEMLEMLGGVLQQDRSQIESRLTHLQLLAISRQLLLHLVPLEIADRCLPRQMKSALCSVLFDGPLYCFYPILHADLRQYTQTFRNVRDVDSIKLFESTLVVAESLKSAAELLQQQNVEDGSKFVLNTEYALTSLSFHQDYRFIPLILNGCSKYYNRWHLTETENHTLTCILLKLLAHSDINVRRKAYSHLHQLVLEHLGVRNLSHHSPAESLAFLLFNTPLLLEITTHGISCEDDLVQSCAEDIMLHALKGKFVLGSGYWAQFLSSLEPVLPLLQCWSSKPSSLGRSIITMLNPDVGSQMSLGAAELLKGNLRLMFSKDEFVRGEALSRLIWLLTKEEDAFEKLPHIATLHNCVTNHVCLVENPVDILSNIPDQPFYQESSLIQVMEIIESSGLDPRMLISALTQIAAIVEDPRHHETFLSRAGLSLSVDFLHAALLEKRYDVYPEVAVPIISILKSISLHHSISRHQLSKNINIFYGIVRGLLMFPSDKNLHVNASQLLAVLLYNDVVISASPHALVDGFVVRGLSIPHIIGLKMNLPFVFSKHWKTSHYTEPLMTDILMHQKESKTFLATVWNLSYFKGKESPLFWQIGMKLSKPILDAQKQMSSSLLLSERNLLTLQASAMFNLCQKQLLNIQDAATHSEVAKSLDVLKSILSLYWILKKNNYLEEQSSSDTLHFKQSYKNLPWRHTFRRFLMAAPASVDDQNLLVLILRFLRKHVSSLYDLGFHFKDGRWLSKQLQHPSQPLPNMFHTVAHTGYAGDNEMPQELEHLPKWKELCKELLNVVKECADFEQHFLIKKDSSIKISASNPFNSDNNKENEGEKKKNTHNKTKQKPEINRKASCETELEQADVWVGEVLSSSTDKAILSHDTNWAHLIQNIVNCLKSSDTQHFYNLAYLDWLLWTITHLTSRQDWSIAMSGAQLRTLFSELLSVLLELVQAFHIECGKGGSSYMGLSITRAAILCLNHLLDEMKRHKEIKWEDFLQTTTTRMSSTAITISWLPSLFQSREIIVRAAALQFAAGIAISAQGQEHLKNLFMGSSDIWMTPLCILLDHSEASIVREQAAYLLSNLVQCRTWSGDWGAGESCNLDILFQRLSENGFLQEICVILDCLSLATSWEPNRHFSGDVGVGLMHWKVPESTKGETNFSHLPSDQCILIPRSNGSEQEAVRAPCTPSFIGSLCKFLDSVMGMSDKILHSFSKEGFSSHLIRCINSVPPMDSQNQRALQLYCDTLRMYASICCLVSRCISCDVGNCQYIHQQPQTYHKLLLLLDPSLFSVESLALQTLRDELWTEILWLISELQTISAGDNSCHEENGHSVLHSLLIRSRGEPLASVLAIALSGSMHTNLQSAALGCLQSLLSHPASAFGQPFAVLLDDVNADFNSSLVAAKETNMEDSIGALLCHSLLALYDVHSFQIGSVDQFYKGTSDWQTHRNSVAGALSSVLETSVSAKAMALKQGLVELLCAQLGAIQNYLIQEPGETMKRLATKRKVCPILQDLDLLIGLLNSISLQNTKAKELASDIGVTDSIHKIWTWCQAQHYLLLSVLRFLATLTSGCPSASHSLVLTSSVPGLGLRRTPSSQSLLHALISLFLQETELATSNHNLSVLTTVSGILCNACHVPECRTIMTKGCLMRGIHNLHSSLSKKNRQKRHVETIWLSLLVQLSAYQEGQVVIPKVPDFFEYLLNLSESQNKNNKLALQILRNISFSLINRPRMLSSGVFVHLLNKKLRDGDTDEQVAAAAALWALTANNQKGKLTAKCAGADVQILDSLRKLAVCHKPGADFVAQLLNCVLKVLRHEPQSSLS